MKPVHFYLATASLFALAACGGGEGDPEAYNLRAVTASGQMQLSSIAVLPRTETEEMQFVEGGDIISPVSSGKLAWLKEQGVQNVRIVTPESDPLRESRELAVVRLLRGLGVERSRIYSETASDLVPHTYLVTVYYGEAKPPVCPNWSSSDPVTSYDNMPFTALGCSNVSNIGVMTLNAEDLQRGSGDKRYDAGRASVNLQKYISGGAAASTSTTSAAATGADSGASEAAVPPAQ